MTHILISFLGRGNPDSNKRYRSTTYDFGSGRKEKTEFFGLGLTRHLRPDRLIILGTTGSMWDVLLFSLGLGPDYEEAMLAVTESADADRTTQAELNYLEAAVSQRLGLPARLCLIPYGRELRQQIDILRAMAAYLSAGDQVSLDVTHGLRHLPMLALVSAVYLQAAYRVKVASIYYGALDMTQNGLTPVMRLDGLLSIVDWAGALRAYDKDGDYSPFAALLENEGVNRQAANQLRQAAFFERNFNVYDARRELLRFSSVLNGGLPGIGGLFEEQLQARTQWHSGVNTFARQRELAHFYLEQRDYPRAAIFAYEAFLTRLVDKNKGEWEFEYDARERAEQAFLAGERGNPDLKNDYRLLEKLRNALAHGSPPKNERVKAILKDEQRLRQKLEHLIKRLLG